ncbi:cytochrome-c peroxidase [Larkinella punicea]|uniref:cytochrome-c peroxidase n=1 Tax=Larkinella punicea TaxID=2315727 RepID=UPI001E37CCFF|nr:cytochrome c peroxidase [Larkinella punicea]
MFRNKSPQPPKGGSKIGEFKSPLGGWGLFLLTTFTGVFLLNYLDSPTAKPVAATERVKQQFSHDLAVFRALIETRFLPLAERSASADSMKTAFLACRRAYKKLEPFAEYYLPATTRLVNGPPLPEIEAEDNRISEPGGLQVIEELIFPEFDVRRRNDLIREIKKLRRELVRYADFEKDTDLTDAHVFDALRLQIFRIITLGISGFDTPRCLNALPEAATSVHTLSTYLSFYNTKTPDFYRLVQILQSTEKHLNQASDFNTFDRFQFITEFANPLSTQVLAFQQQRNIQPFNEIRALRTDAKTLFDTNAFNPDFYAPTVATRSNPAKILLGKKLFSDPVLSAGDDPPGGKRSCASCHQPDKAFTDGLPKNASLSGRGFVRRNTPTLLNAALQNAQFYDLRAQTLENQSSEVIQNVDEMHGSLEYAARTLQQNNVYRAWFEKAFPTLRDSIEPIHIQNALAAYERSLVRLNSRFDRAMREQNNGTGKPLLSTEERLGFNLFMGKAKCGTCHFLPLFNGTVPPVFTQTESEVIGVPVQPNRRQIDPDPGRYALFRLDPLKYAFKTPTVRNIVQTSPYMHNGAYQTLENVLEFYNQGGGRGLGIRLENQTLPTDKLDLTDREQSALLAFLKTLSDHN